MALLKANSCISGAVRLVSGLVNTEGTVELCQNGAWSSVCHQLWGYQEAFVVCRQLKLPTTGNYNKPTVLPKILLSTNDFPISHACLCMQRFSSTVVVPLDVAMEIQVWTTGNVWEMRQSSPTVQEIQTLTVIK